MFERVWSCFESACRDRQYLTALSGRSRGESKDFGTSEHRWDGRFGVRFPELLQHQRGCEEFLPGSRTGEGLFEPPIQAFLTPAFETLELANEDSQPCVVVRSEVVQLREAIAYTNR